MRYNIQRTLVTKISVENVKIMWHWDKPFYISRWKILSYHYVFTIGLNCFVAEREYPSKKKYHDKHRSVGRCVAIKNSMKQAGYYITESPTSITTTRGALTTVKQPEKNKVM